MLQTRSSGSFDLLSMSLIDPPSNFASTGLSTPAGVKLSTPALYPKAAITDNGFDISNVQSYWSYTALSWTPPMDVAGRRFVVCVQATDRLGASAVRCVELSVARCVYCTLAGDTLRSVAAAYHSNWLQVWSTNQGRWSELEDTELASAGLARWSNTKNPNVLPPGVLLRLGPVVPLRAKTSLQTLARRFRTTVAALLAANRDLDAASSTVPAGQAVCVLPDVCAS
mmetsp:Transcript_88930/g.237048  ORF Transcript_88930/g.237048 Transcript_88930/m.237048 type:complete len:226 (-) Transcript_88930:435-1112(-)